MPKRPTQGGLLLLTLLQQFPATVFLYGEPFFARERFQWSTGKIGLSQAMVGLAIAISSYIGGKIAHKKNPRAGVALGILFSIAFSLLGWAFGGTEPIFVLTFVGFAFFSALVWPGIEVALVEGQPLGRMAHRISYYNLTWSIGSALSFLLATPLMAWLGLKALLLLPAILYLINLLLLRWLFPAHISPDTDVAETSDELTEEARLEEERKRLSPEERRGFRILGWIANPFGVVAINVFLSSSPAIQTRLHIPFAEASMWCSVWLFFRTLSFEWVRRWTWWHYRWGFLVGVFFVMMVSFGATTLAPNLAALVVAQSLFGLCLGLLYQSSLFYSLADSEAAGEHGGVHECVIGLGNMSGNLVLYFSSLWFAQSVQLPIFCVLGVMAIGWGTLLRLGLKLRALRLSSA